ncbi:hypothetical protein HN51_008790 [Arachis hypogaea]
MDALDIEKWRFISQSPEKSVGISSVLLGVILVERAAFVFPLSFLSNLLQKSPHVKIDLKQQVTIWWSSLMRGAVSIAVAYNQLKRQENYSYMVVISTNSFPSYTRVQITLNTPHSLSKNTSTFSFTSFDPIPITPNNIQLLQIVIRRRILIRQRSGISFVLIFREEEEVDRFSKVQESFLTSSSTLNIHEEDEA